MLKEYWERDAEDVVEERTEVSIGAAYIDNQTTEVMTGKQ